MTEYQRKIKWGLDHDLNSPLSKIQQYEDDYKYELTFDDKKQKELNEMREHFDLLLERWNTKFYLNFV